MRLDQELWNAEALQRLIDTDDLDLLVDSIEAETDLWECLDELHQTILDDDAAIEGVKSVMARLQDRADAAKHRQGKVREAIFKAMNRLGLTSIKRPTATFSVRKGGQKVDIYDEKELPTQFYKNEPVLQRAALTKALKEGESVPGAQLVEGKPTLSIRV